MFESLSTKLGNVFTKLRGKGSLSENDVMAVSREIRVALLEADVALPVVKDFIEGIKKKAVGQDVIKGVNPGQQVVKIVHDELVKMLGSESSDLKFGPAPSAFMMVGLQGSGKTTSTAKIAKFLSDKQKKKILMASLDIYRPAAQEQLKQLGAQTGITTLPIVEGHRAAQDRDGAGRRRVVPEHARAETARHRQACDGYGPQGRFRHRHARYGRPPIDR